MDRTLIYKLDVMKMNGMMLIPCFQNILFQLSMWLGNFTIKQYSLKSEKTESTIIFILSVEFYDTPAFDNVITTFENIMKNQLGGSIIE